MAPHLHDRDVQKRRLAAPFAARPRTLEEFGTQTVPFGRPEHLRSFDETAGTKADVNRAAPAQDVVAGEDVALLRDNDATRVGV